MIFFLYQFINKIGQNLTNMSKMVHVLAVPELAILVCNSYMICTNRSIEIVPRGGPPTFKLMLMISRGGPPPMGSMWMNSKVQFGTLWTQIKQTSHCVFWLLIFSYFSYPLISIYTTLLLLLFSSSLVQHGYFCILMRPKNTWIASNSARHLLWPPLESFVQKEFIKVDESSGCN